MMSCSWTQSFVTDSPIFNVMRDMVFCRSNYPLGHTVPPHGSLKRNLKIAVGNVPPGVYRFRLRFREPSKKFHFQDAPMRPPLELTSQTIEWEVGASETTPWR